MHILFLRKQSTKTVIQRMHSKKLLKKLYKAMKEFISVMMQTFSLKGHSSGTPVALQGHSGYLCTWRVLGHSKSTQRAFGPQGIRALEHLRHSRNLENTSVLVCSGRLITQALRRSSTWVLEKRVAFFNF